MGRHRRSAAGRAATGRATGITETHGSYTGGYDPHDSYDWHAGDTVGRAPHLAPEGHSQARVKSEAYLFATEEDYAVVFPDAGGTSNDARGGRRRRKKAATPVRTGLLGVSAAVAIGTVAVAAGAVPGLDNYKLGGGTGNSDSVQAAGSPSNSATEQGGTSGSAQSRDGGSSTSRGADRAAKPSATPSASASASAPAASTTAPPKAPVKKPSATPPSTKPVTTPSRKTTAPPAAQKTTAPVTVSAVAAAEAEVLKLVNEQRAAVGCSALSASSSLTSLAEDFSEQMAAEDFFDHTDPSGATPWDRAAKAGITALGGENIARGQADAAAVMDAWMNSPGHKANILNCDFKTLGVGVHFGTGGPWWTQDFGY
ncbi:CAP domain-containing protein [Streptomyces sp. NPDC005423]|uniref:CAP domain-containing protein n=1 Tax=Streptomyces sp. NPDC005423 TaxID=3155343 RepID=UPI0033ACE7CF